MKNNNVKIANMENIVNISIQNYDYAPAKISIWSKNSIFTRIYRDKFYLQISFHFSMAFAPKRIHIAKTHLSFLPFEAFELPKR